MSVQVILVEDYPSLGHVGDVVNVAAGYARNFLIPLGKAVDASSRNGKQLAHKMVAIQAKRTKLKAQAESFGKVLASKPLEFTLKVGEAGKTFGAVTSRDLEAAFKAIGHDINKKQIKLNEPLKSAGEYQIDVKVHADVLVAVTVKVNVEAPKKLASDEEPKTGGKKRAPKKVKAAEDLPEGDVTEH